MTAATTKSRLDPRLIAGALILLLAIGVFAAEIRSIEAINFWWLDELASLFRSDPSIGPRTVLTSRILTDSNPPLYYSALYAFRHLVADDRSAMITLNIVSIIVGFIALIVVTKDKILRGLALAAEAAFLLSGPVLRYSVEGRSYLTALVLVFLISWCCALLIEIPGKRINPWLIGAIGAVAALTHFFAAVYCGCLAAGLIAISVFYRRAELTKPALVLGLSAVVFSGAWLLFGIHHTHQIDWIEFTRASVYLAAYEAARLEFGPYEIRAAFILIFSISLFFPNSHQIGLLFSVCFVLFIIIPILISLKMPIIVARYWIIGTPGITVYAIWLARAAFVRAAEPPNRRLYLVGGVAVVGFLVANSIAGFFAARDATAQKEIWSGAAIVAPLLHDCPPASIRTNEWNAEFYAYVAHAPANLFVSPTKPLAPDSGPPHSSCRVLGWAEHVTGTDQFLNHYSDAKLLDLINLKASPSQVLILRHAQGYVVLRVLSGKR